MPYGKAIELFLVNGSPDSIVTAELSNWNGKAIKIPRIDVPNCGREDITQAGVYFLFCKGDDGTEAVYIGEAENVKDRLVQHIRDYQAEKEAYYWSTAVIFIGRDLNKALIRYLENSLVTMARSCNRYTVLTKNTYRNTVMKESQIAVMDEFIDNVKVLINALGYKVLEPVLSTQPQNASALDHYMLQISTGTVMAQGKVTTEGFVVLKDSTVDPVSRKSLAQGVVKLRTKYFQGGQVKDGKLTEDILFSSSSTAADFLLGYSASGPQTWRTKDGRTLKELESDALQTQGASGT